MADQFSFNEGERTRLLRALAIIEGVLPSLQRIVAAKDGSEADPTFIAQSIEKLRKLESIPFEQAKQLYFSICMAIARGEEWRLTGETISALLEVRDVLKESMRATAESEGKGAEYETAERNFEQYMDDFHNPYAPLKEILDIKSGNRGELKALRSLLKDPKTTARAIEAMERQGLDASDIKRLATKYRNPEDLEKALRNAERLQLLGVEEFSRQEVAATRKAFLRWVVKAFCYVAAALAMLWILVIVIRLFGR